MNEPVFEAFNDEQHPCIGHNEGDWIIFTCPICKDYERRVNWKTGGVKVRRGGSKFNHFGSHAPVSTYIENFSTN